MAKSRVSAKSRADVGAVRNSHTGGLVPQRQKTYFEAVAVMRPIFARQQPSLDCLAAKESAIPMGSGGIRMILLT
ncbi:hypothetical protein DPM33_21795 [Mesorhizobium hawassense]|uniref:Uncharacterized protein n=1 Tax=Mesorhizobium hawassense TaxID=1209954 RepID=A0A330HLS2_9HYPH|nr:hypothetical protein DPM33_21795 [Mesorhizobium hawassense]